MKLINLTPHTINIIDKINLSIGPSGKSLRVSQEMNPVKETDGVTFYKSTYGQLEMIDNDTKKVVSSELPPMGADTIYIVSGQCLEALKGVRSDFASPGELVRDDKGQPVGCKGLRIS